MGIFLDTCSIVRQGTKKYDPGGYDPVRSESAPLQDEFRHRTPLPLLPEIPDALADSHEELDRLYRHGGPSILVRAFGNSLDPTLMDVSCVSKVFLDAKHL